MMTYRGVVLLVLLLALSCWENVNAKSSEQSGSHSKLSEAVKKNPDLCTLCEEFATTAALYLKENKTQTEIIDVLHQACTELPPYEEQCILLVDYYASIFFLEIDEIQPEDFCRKVNLCRKRMSVDLPMTNEFCSACNDFVTEVISKLDDADTQMEVIVTLLKACRKVEQNYVQQCKKMVLKYAPLILANGVKFLQKTDVCTAIHACMANQEVLLSSAVLVSSV